MSDTNLQIRFTGPELDGHSMDVILLAPSLMAIGELCTEANNILNGNKAKVKVLIKADVKANCVTVGFQIHQTFWQAAQGLIANPKISTAKEILEWLGIITGTATGAVALTVGGVKTAKGLIGYLRWKQERKEKSAELKKTDNGNVYFVTVIGDNNVIGADNNVRIVPEQTYLLSKSIKTVEAVKTLVSPVKEQNGINDASFIHDKKEVKIDQQAAKELGRAFADTDEIQPQYFTAYITIYGPVLDTKSKHWKFKLNNRVEDIDISETIIAEEAIARGVVNVGDTYTVRIEMKQHQKKNGDYASDLKIKEVLGFKQGENRQQIKLI